MLHREALFFTTTILVLFVKLPSVRGNLTANQYELMISKIDSRLQVATKLIQGAREQLQDDIQQLCGSSSGYSGVINCRMLMKNYPNEKPRDCSDIYKNGYHSNGIYKIWPESAISNEPLNVYCDMQDGGGWTVIQRRGDFGNAEDYFYQDWNTYKFGFGHLSNEFWIGNDNLFTLTSQRSNQLRVDLGDWEGNFTYATYSEFWIDSELLNYTLHVRGYNGTAGDSFKDHNGDQFTTKDRDNDKSESVNCAIRWEGAWWYDKCYFVNLNGLYLKGQHDEKKAGVNWSTFRGNEYSLKDAVMKIRPADF